MPSSERDRKSPPDRNAAPSQQSPGDDPCKPGEPDTNRPKVVFLGDTCVGKTSLAHALVGRDFEPTPSTHGIQIWPIRGAADIDPEGLLLDVGGEFGPQIAGGRLEFSAAVVVVDSEPEVIERSVRTWGDRLHKKTNRRDYRHILVRARIDRGNAVADDEFAAIARANGFHSSFSTSAKTGVGIQELREAVLDAARWYADQDNEAEDEVGFVVRTLTERLCELIARNPSSLDRIEWRDLERVIAVSLRELGFTVDLTPPSKDGGKDVIATVRLGLERRVYYVEIKHWRSRKSPGPQYVSDFVEINLRDNTDGGLFLSSSGFTPDVHARLALITRQRVRLGGRDKIVHLCQQFVRKREGVWFPAGPLPDLLFDDTVG